MNFNPGGLRPDLVDLFAGFDRRLRALERGYASLTFANQGNTILNFGLTTSTVQLAVATLDVPEWASRAIVLAVGNVAAVNNSGSDNYLLVSAYVGGTSGGESFETVKNGDYGSSSASTQRYVNNPSGTINFSIRARVNSGAAWTAAAANIANVDGIAIFLR